MSVQLFKDGESEVFDEFTFKDRLNEGWSLSAEPTEAVEEELETEDDLEESSWLHPGDLPDNPTDAQVKEFARQAEIPYLAMKNAETLKKELGYAYEG